MLLLEKLVSFRSLLCVPWYLLSKPQRQHNTTQPQHRSWVDTKMTLQTRTTHHRNSTLAFRSLRLTFIDLNVISNNKQVRNNKITMPATALTTTTTTLTTTTITIWTTTAAKSTTKTIVASRGVNYTLLAITKPNMNTATKIRTTTTILPYQR